MSQANLIAAIHASKPKIAAFPRREFDASLPIAFETRENENRWFRLFKSIEWMKPMISSLAPHRETLMSLDIKRKVFHLFNGALLNIDLVMGLPAYQSLVYEFIASFEVIHGERMFDENSAWEFRIQNTKFHWSRQQTTYFLDFPEFGMQPKPTSQQVRTFWKKLAWYEDFGPKESPNYIMCGAWRYVHRLIATNINAQPETVNLVTQDDLDIMWALEEKEPIDWFTVFSTKFLKMQDPYQQDFVGCTSLITQIAKMCGFKFNCEPSESRALDLPCLKKLRILSRKIDSGHPLTDVSEDEEDPDEDVPMDDPVDEPEPVAESNQPEEMQREAEAEKANSIHDKVNWEKVRRVVVYEFH